MAIDDGFLPNEQPMSAAGVPLPRTIGGLKDIPSMPIGLPAQSEAQGDGFEPDGFQPDTPATAGGGIPERHPSGREWGDLERQVLGLPPKPQPEGPFTAAIKAPFRKAGEAYNTLASAGEPNIGWLSRLGRVGAAGLETLQIPFAAQATLGGRATGAINEYLPQGVTEQTNAPVGHPWRQAGLPPAQQAAAAREVGELVGGAVGPLAIARRLRGILPGRGTPGVELPPAGPVGPKPSALGELPETPGLITQPGPQSTLEAAKETMAGRALDFGEVGRRRAAARAADEAVYPSEVGQATPGSPVTPAVPSGGAAEAGTETARVAEASKTFMDKARENIAYLKTKAEIPSVWGHPPSDVARGVAPAENLVSKVQNKAGLVDGIYADLTRKVQDIYKGLDEAAIARVNKLLDTEGGAAGVAQLVPAEQKAYGAARKMFDELADATGIEPGKRVTDYFPQVREQLGIEGRKIIRMGGKDIPTYITETTPRRIVKEWFEKDRTSGLPADDLGLSPVLAYVRGASRRIGFGGGRDPRTGEIITSLLKDIEPEIGQIPEKLSPYFTQYVNDVLGIPRANAGNPGISHELAGTLKGWQFGRTIGGSPTSPIANVMQQALTFAEVNPKNFALAYKDLAKLRSATEEAKLRSAGVLDALGPAEHDFINQVTGKGLHKLSHQIASKTGIVFQGTEKVNRAHAYYAGLREAADRGLQGPAAEQFAKDVVRKTQFMFGKEDLPAGFRSPLSEHALPALLQTSARQFKNFPIKYSMALKNMVMDDAKNLPAFLKSAGTLDLKGMMATAPTKTAKFAGLTGALFGSDAITMGLDKAALGEDMPWQTPGLVGALGMSLGHQAGLGAIPAEDFNSLLFFLPGPLVANALDAASAAASLTTGKDVDLTVTSFGRGQNVLQNLGQLGPADPDKIANWLTRSVPVAGMSLNRLRQAVVHYMAEDANMVRRPLTLPQAFGMESVPASAPIRRPATAGQAGESVKMGLGMISPRQDETQKLRDIISKQTNADDKVVRRAAQLLIGGQQEQALKLLNDNGVMITPGALQSAVEAATMEPVMNQALKARLPRRGESMEKLRRLPGGFFPGATEP